MPRKSIPAGRDWQTGKTVGTSRPLRINGASASSPQNPGVARARLEVKMPNPKRRHSKARRDKRRAHDALSNPGTSVCANCGAPKLSHRVCASCGYYRGRQVVKVKSDL